MEEKIAQSCLGVKEGLFFAQVKDRPGKSDNDAGLLLVVCRWVPMVGATQFCVPIKM